MSTGPLPPKLLLLPPPLRNVNAVGTRQLTKRPLILHPKGCPAGTRLTPLLRLQDTPQDTPPHTHLQTADGMKPLAALKAARHQGPPPVPACGTPLPVTHLLALPPLAETRLATPHLAMVEPQEAYARTAGTKPQRQRGKRRDTGVAGLKRHAQTEEMSRWARLQPQGPVRGSLGGMKPLPVRWDPQHHYSPREKLPSERQL